MFIQSFIGVMTNILILHTERLSEKVNLNTTVVLSHSHSVLSTLPQADPYHFPTHTHGKVTINM